MTVAFDTDVIVQWQMGGAPRHGLVRHFVESTVKSGDTIGITPQVLLEFLHICTDARRFAHPLSMRQALDRVLGLWTAREVIQILPTRSVIPRVVDLMGALHLGRQRVLDTAVAATLGAAGVRSLATLNGRDYEIFPFLEIVGP